MTDVVLPSTAPVKSIRWRTISPAGTSGNQYTGQIRARALGGDRMGCTIDFAVTNETKRAQLLSFIGELRGKVNTALIVDPGYRMRGSYPGGELLPNFDFENGTTGFDDGGNYNASVTDGVFRSTKNSYSATAPLVGNVSGVPVAVGDLILARVHNKIGRGAYSNIGVYLGSSNSDQSWGKQIGGTQSGLYFCGGAAQTTGAFITSVDLQGGPGIIAGDYIENSFISVTRCAQIDGGGNTTTRSDEIGDAAWSKGNIASVASNASAAPDGTTTADSVVENSSAGQHFFSQSGTRTSSAAWICSYGFFKRNAGTRNVMLVAGNTTSNYSSALFTLTASGFGTVGSVSNAGTATLGRAFMRYMGNDWYYCCVLSYNVAATTNLVQVNMHNGTSDSYTGDGTSSILAWRVGVTVSDVPTMGTQTTSAAIAAQAAAKGLGFNLKGLPVSTQNLLRKNDYASVMSGSQIFYRQLAAPLHSDAAGLGHIQFTLPIPFDVAADALVAIHRPLARMVCVSDIPEWLTEPGIFSTATLDFEEKYDA